MNEKEVLDVLGGTRYRPDADHFYDIMRGGLVWRDEMPDRESDPQRFMKSILILAKVIAYRASLTLGEPNLKYEKDWEELRVILPSWPGFREDRIFTKEIERELRIIKKREERCLDRLEEELDTQNN